MLHDNVIHLCTKLLQSSAKQILHFFICHGMTSKVLLANCFCTRDGHNLAMLESLHAGQPVVAAYNSCAKVTSANAALPPDLSPLPLMAMPSPPAAWWAAFAEECCLPIPVGCLRMGLSEVQLSSEAALQGAARSFAFASGMAALSVVLRLVRAGQHVVAGDDIYGGTSRLLAQVAPGLGIDVTNVDTSDPV